jgi:PAS domain S-box-containing protein
VAARAAGRSTQQELTDSRQDLENLIYALDQSAIVARTTVGGTITYVNDAFCRISKYSREELIGQNHRVVNSGLHPLEFFRELYDTISAGRVWQGEIRNRAKDGSFYWVDTTIVPLLGADQRPYEYIAIRHEITERKRSEAALRDQAALAQLGKLAAVVAHEVRNPLAGIRGALQIIAPRLPSGGREQAVIDEAVQRIDALNEIVEDLLLFARPARPSIGPAAVPQLVSETVALFKQDPSVRGITVDVVASDTSVLADPTHVKQVLLNVLMNSAQAMQGRGRIRISSQAIDEVVEIRVADEGPGIPAEVRERLFEPFFTTRHRGTGLGLSTAQRLMHAQGGSIRLECPPGGGTVAVIGLKLLGREA